MPICQAYKCTNTSFSKSFSIAVLVFVWYFQCEIWLIVSRSCIEIEIYKKTNKQTKNLLHQK